MHSARSVWAASAAARSTGVSGLNARPVPSPSERASAAAAGTSAQASTWKVTLSPPASRICSKWRSGSSTIRWQSSRPPAACTTGASARTTTGPIVIGGMKRPSPTSMWKIRAPAAEQLVRLPPELQEVGGVDRRLDLDSAYPVAPAHEGILMDAGGAPRRNLTCRVCAEASAGTRVAAGDGTAATRRRGRRGAGRAYPRSPRSPRR